MKTKPTNIIPQDFINKAGKQSKVVWPSPDLLTTDEKAALYVFHWQRQRTRLAQQRAKVRAWQQNNKEKCALQNKKYRELNHEQIQEYNESYRALKKEGKL